MIEDLISHIEKVKLDKEEKEKEKISSTISWQFNPPVLFPYSKSLLRVGPCKYNGKQSGKTTGK
jgi:hypothetical protein